MGERGSDMGDGVGELGRVAVRYGGWGVRYGGRVEMKYWGEVGGETWGRWGESGRHGGEDESKGYPHVVSP